MADDTPNPLLPPVPVADYSEQLLAAQKFLWSRGIHQPKPVYGKPPTRLEEIRRRAQARR